MKRAFRTLLTLPCLTLPALATQVAVTEMMYNPPAGKPEWIEIANLTSNRIDTAQWALRGGVDYTFPGFNAGAASAHFLREYERIILSSADEATTRAAYGNIPPNVRVFGPWTGQLDNNGESVVLRDAAGALQTELSYGDNSPWPRSPDGAGHSLQIINQDRKVDDWRNWRASKQTGGTPGSVEATLAEQPVSSPTISSGTTTTVTEFNGTTVTNLVPLPANPGDSRWRYWNGTSAPQTDWNSVAEASLPPLVVPANAALPGWGPSAPATQGFAPLGFETTSGVAFPGIRTTVTQTSGLLTYYYRTTFNWTGPVTGNSFSIDQYIDDGAIFYLNGGEIGRVRMPNPPGHTSTAEPTAAPDESYEPNGTSGGPVALDGKLVNGTNILAVELHQNAGGSSDHVCAVRLKISSSAPAGVLINEVKPGAAGSGFVEFYNPTGSPVDLQNWYLSDNAGLLTKFQITGSLVVPAMGFATIGYSESSLSLSSPVVVILTQPDGTSRQSHISSGMAIDGRSLGRKPAGGASWFLFTSPTPAADNFSSGGGDSSPIRLSEAHFAASGNVEWVEVHNASTSALSGAGLYISSKPDLSDKVAIGSSISGGGYASVNVDFATAAGDVTLYLSDASNNILAAEAVEYRTGLPSVQVWPAGGSEWYAGATDTRDAANNPARSTDIVINEIMYDSPSNHADGEFVEITNRGAGSVNIGGWRFNKGIDFDLPPNTMIAPGEFIVLAKSPAFITANYGGGVRVYGPVDGTLGNSGDFLRLEDGSQNLADSVDYKDGGNWPALAAGQGSSLELIHPDMDNSLASSWRSSDESAKSTLQSYSHTGTYKELRGSMADGTVRSTANGNTNIPFVSEARELLLNLVSDGYIIMDNIKLSAAATPATNIIPSGDATSHGTGTGASGFLCMGTHRMSDTIGGQFHLISHGGGDVKANKAEVDITALSTTPGTYTLSFDARWVSGMPLLVAQTWDRSFGKVFRLPIPNNLGTPGAGNSMLRAAPAPTVDSIRHSPAVPTSTQSVVVTARVSSAAPLTAVVLRERTDNVAGNGVWNTVAMNDGGTAGDATAGDGIWSATVAPRADSTITQFYVRATTAAGQVNECPRTPETIPAVNGTSIGTYGRPAMWIVDNSPATTEPGLLTERHIFSLYDRNAMNTGTGFTATYDWDFPRMSNFGMNSTMIFNETEIYYGCEFRKGGSPWTRTDGNTMERARWRAPSDALFRDRSKNAIDSDGSATNGPARFHNRIVRYMMHLMGYPIPDAEFVQYVVNADAPTWRDEMEMTDSDFFDRAYGDGGELFEIDDAWYMYDTGNHNDRISADGLTGRWSLTDWSNASIGANPSDESPIYFHVNWPLRFPEANYDYGALSSFMKAAVALGAPVTVTGNATDDVLTASGHGVTTGTQITVRFTGSVGGLINGGNYFVIRLSSETMKLATTLANANNGVAVNFSVNFTGTIEVPFSDTTPSGAAYRERMERMIDVDRAAIYTAVRGYIGDWDNFTLNRGKNGYFYRRPTDGKFEFHHWDSDLGFQNTGEAFIGTTGGTGWTNFSNRPWFRQRYSHYLTELLTRYTKGSPRMTAWLAAMNYQSGNIHGNAPFKTAAFDYTAWFTNREANAIASVNSLGGTNYTRAFAVTTANNQTVATPLFSIAGSAGSNTSIVEAQNHPEAVFTWVPTAANLGSWTISGVALMNGANALNIRALGSDGTLLASQALTVTLSVNAPPLAVLTADPGSLRIAANEVIVLDATGSSDPEATALTYAWSVTPSTGTTAAHSVPGNTEARFAIPGIYTVSVTVTDGASLTATATREVTVFNANDFQPFAATAPLGPAWSVQNVEVRDNFSPSSWYSVEDISGRLMVQVLDDAAYPLNSPTFTHPLITRDLPDTSDFILQTDLEPDTREFGNWQAGLWLTTVEGGTTVHYSFGLDGGTSVIARRAVQPGAWVSLESQAVTGSGATLRIRRTGATLAFERLNGSTWTSVATQTVAAGSTAGTGGVFAATAQATTVRISFDYVLLSDSGAFNPVLAALRITEVHYNPAPGGVEYIELRNTGAQAISLAGVSFGDGQPFAIAGVPTTPYTFGAEMLAPGEFIVVTENNTAFQTLYGNTARLAPAWSNGNLSNGGERITLRDATGNSIHDFTYDDIAPWPLAADGTGPSMEVVNVNGDYNSGTNWRASGEATGSPGYLGMGPDTDGDGYLDSLEALFGTNPNDRNTSPLAASSINASGHVALSWPFTAGVLYDVEYSTDLLDWTVLQTVDSDGTWTDTAAATNQRRCYRIKARLP